MVRLSVNFVGIDGAIKMIKNVKGQTKLVADETTKRAAKEFRDLVKVKIPHKWGRPGHGPRHNTPTSLTKRVHFKKSRTKGGVSYRVFFDRKEDADIPSIVESGVAREYPQWRNPIFSKRLHPPIKASHFWEESIKEIIPKLDGYMADAAKKIVG